MRTFLAFILGLCIGVGVLWYYNSTRQKPASARNAAVQAENAAKSAGATIEEKLRALNLSPQTVKEELARTGQVVRRKAQAAGQAIADATADTRITATIKGKLAVSRDLAHNDISVSTSAGVVTLSGAVATPDDVSKAVAMAMDTDGVREVVSKLQPATQAAGAPTGK